MVLYCCQRVYPTFKVPGVNTGAILIIRIQFYFEAGFYCKGMVENQRLLVLALQTGECLITGVL